jgi:hypothetical protein
MPNRPRHVAMVLVGLPFAFAVPAEVGGRTAVASELPAPGHRVVRSGTASPPARPEAPIVVPRRNPPLPVSPPPAIAIPRPTLAPRPSTPATVTPVLPPTGWAPGVEGGRVDPGLRVRNPIACVPRPWRVDVAVANAFRPAFEGRLGGVDAGVSDAIRFDGIDPAGAIGESIGARIGVEGPVFAAGTIEWALTWFPDATEDRTRRGRFGFREMPGSPPEASIVHDARLHAASETIDVGLRTWFSPGDAGLDVGIGARWISLDESVRADGLEPPLPGFAGAANVQSDASTDVFAVDLGVRTRFGLADGLSVGAATHGLVGIRASDVEVRDTSLLAPGPHRSTADDTALAFGASASVELRLALSTGIDAIVGWEGLWLDSVTRAADSLRFDRGASGAAHASIDGDAALLHTLYFGFGITW